MIDTNLERFWAKVEKTENCWNWTAGKFWNGYGQFWLGGTVVKAHRFAYVITKGRIPKSLVVDHLCRNRACVNPDHLELVTNKENLLRGEGWAAVRARKTHCPQGHPYTGDNILIGKKGIGRSCRTCSLIRSKEAYQRKRKKSQK